MRPVGLRFGPQGLRSSFFGSSFLTHHIVLQWNPDLTYPDLTYKCFRPGQSHSKMYGEEPRFNEPRFKVIPDITNKIWRTERKNYPDITNKMSSRHRRRIQQEMKPIIFCLFSKNIVSSYPLHAAKQSVIVAI